MAFFLLIVLCFLINQINFTISQLPTNYPLSVYKMSKLLEIEHDVVLKIERAQSNQNLTNRQREICTNFINDAKKGSEKLADESRQNALYIFQILRRYYDFPKFLFYNLTLELEELFIREKVRWPSIADIFESIDSINRIVEHYDLDPKNVRNGKFIPGEISNIKLDARSCFLIGSRLFDKGLLALAIEWFQLSQEIHLSEKDNSIPLNEIELSLSMAIYWHDVYFKENLKNFFNRRVLPYNETPLVRYIIRRNISDSIGQKLVDSNEEEYVFKALCKGESLLPEIERSKLFCHYRHYYMAMKVEVLSRNPDIIQIYDVIEEGRINDFKNLGLKNQLRPSQIRNVLEDSNEDLITLRSSHSTFLINITHPTISMTEDRIALLTGLEIKRKYSSDSFQVAAYAPGGHFITHMDTLLVKEDNPFGDTLGTFMIYLSDVTLGGSTAFIEARVAAKPIKGSAVFWWSEEKDGTILVNVNHGGCPVIKGHKWIANKWIHYKEQFRNIPCDLKQKKY